MKAKTRKYTSNSANTQDRVQGAIDAIIGMFERGDLPAAIAQTVIHAKETAAPMSRWSLGNQLLCVSAGTTDARGYRQWQEVGRQVRKGAKAIYILGPVTRKITETDADGNEAERIIIVGFKAIPVFAVEDTEGANLETYDYSPEQLPPLREVAEAYGVRVDYGPCLGDYRGYFSPSGNRIMLCTHDVRTWFHELAHAVHNTFRPKQGRGQESDRECVAETVAATLCHLYGYTGYIYHGYEYIKGYAKDGNVGKAIMQVLADVQRTLTLILEAADSDPFAETTDRELAVAV